MTHKDKNRKKMMRFAAAGMACLMLADPLQVSAAESGGMLLTAGVGSVFETSLTAEEYLSIAEQAKGAL